MTLAIHLLCWAISLGSAACFGVLWGRRHERRTLLGPVIPGSGERRIGDFEDQLRRKVGAKRMHANPDAAPILRQARIRR